METSTKWALGIGAAVVAFFGWSKFSGANSAPSIPKLPAPANWPDFVTVPVKVLPHSGFDAQRVMYGYNVDTQQERWFTDSDSILYSALENKSLQVAGIPGYVFYANDNGKVARYWRSQPLS